MPAHAPNTLHPVASAVARLALLLTLLVGLLGSLLVVGASTAEAASSSYGQRALQEAPKHRGKPYKWGAEGPSRFDCSGFTRYLFARQGKSLPHSSSAQYSKIAKVAKSAKQPGDLVFTYNSRGIYHVGIYAGNGQMWAATKSGDVVRKQKIWTSSYKVGRVT